MCHYPECKVWLNFTPIVCEVAALTIYFGLHSTDLMLLIEFKESPVYLYCTHAGTLFWVIKNVKLKVFTVQTRALSPTYY